MTNQIVGDKINILKSTDVVENGKMAVAGQALARNEAL